MKKKKNPEWFQGNCVSWLQIFNCILVQTDSSSLFERLCGRLQSGHHLYPKLSAYHCHCRWLGIIQFLNIIFYSRVSWLCPYCSGVLLLCCSLRCPALIAAPFCQCQSTESAGASVNCGCWSSSYPEFPHFLHWTSLIASAVIAVFHQFCGLRPCTHLTGKSYFRDRPDMAYMSWGGLAWGHSNAYACLYTMWKKVLDRTSTFFNSGIFSLSPAADFVQTFSGNC